MAAAWNGGVPGGEQFVKDPSLLSAISSGMDFWFENDYQDQACLDNGGNAACPCGTPGLWNTNWFSNVGSRYLLLTLQSKNQYYRSSSSQTSLLKHAFWSEQILRTPSMEIAHTFPAARTEHSTTSSAVLG